MIAKKEKKLSLSKVKTKAWKAFSRYIRLRDCLVTTGTKDYGLCFTCGRKKHFKELEAGHFVDSRCNAILFEEDGVHAQCHQCNCYKSGNKDAYTPKMIELYGLKRVEELQQQKYTTVVYKIWDYEKIEKEYRDLYNEVYANN